MNRAKRESRNTVATRTLKFLFIYFFFFTKSSPSHTVLCNIPLPTLYYTVLYNAVCIVCVCVNTYIRTYFYIYTHTQKPVSLFHVGRPRDFHKTTALQNKHQIYYFKMQLKALTPSFLPNLSSRKNNKPTKNEV